jgi:hypothetical protein
MLGKLIHRSLTHLSVFSYGQYLKLAFIGSKHGAQREEITVPTVTPLEEVQECEAILP